jgi:hypothetical protein
MALIPYNKYKKLHITFESRNEIRPYFINNKVNPNFFNLIKKSNIKIDYKPIGLWFSCGTSWFNWCMAEMPDWVTKKKVYNIILDETKILHINSLKKLLEFNKKYSIKKSFTGMSNNIDTGKREKTTDIYTLINWGKVSSEYSGIKFCPYLEQKLRTKDKNYIENFTWYIMLDAATGCIWNQDALKTIEYGGYLPEYNMNLHKIKHKLEDILNKFI